MAFFRALTSASGGGDSLSYQYKSLTWVANQSLTIPTSKKASGFAGMIDGRAVSVDTDEVFLVDGSIDATPIVISDNAITITYSWSTSRNVAVQIYVIYIE